MARIPSLAAPPPPPSVESPPKRHSTRIGKRALSAWLDPTLYEEFRVVCLRRHVSVQQAVEEMMLEWMQRQGAKPPRR